jgi:hypothetical protein
MAGRPKKDERSAVLDFFAEVGSQLHLKRTFSIKKKRQRKKSLF